MLLLLSPLSSIIVVAHTLRIVVLHTCPRVERRQRRIALRRTYDVNVNVDAIQHGRGPGVVPRTPENSARTL